MGQRGPLPKPTLKLADGLGDEPKKRGKGIPSGRPECPDFLSASAKEEWERIVPELDGAGLLSPIDRGSLAAWCQAYAELEWATRTIETEGRIVEEPIQNSQGEVIGAKKKAHPAVKMQRDAFNRLARMIVEFGLSHATRMRMGGVSGGGDAGTGEAGNPFALLQARAQQARGRAGG